MVIGGAGVVSGAADGAGLAGLEALGEGGGFGLFSGGGLGADEGIFGLPLVVVAAVLVGLLGFDRRDGAVGGGGGVYLAGLAA